MIHNSKHSGSYNTYILDEGVSALDFYFYFIKSCTELANHLALHENRLVFSSYGNQVSTELVRWVFVKKEGVREASFSVQFRKWQMWGSAQTRGQEGQNS